MLWITKIISFVITFRITVGIISLFDVMRLEMRSVSATFLAI